MKETIAKIFRYDADDCPFDWNIVQLTDIADLISGYSYSGDELVEESDCALATIKNFDRTGGFKLDGYKPLNVLGKVKPDQNIDIFDVLVAHTDLTQNADVIGNAEIVLSSGKYDKITMSMDLVKVKSKNNCMSNHLIAALLSSERFKNHALGYTNGSTVLHLSKDALREYKFALPNDPDVISKYDEFAKSIHEMMSSIMKENQYLSSIRDTLLPKLMSGEIDVSTLELDN